MKVEPLAEFGVVDGSSLTTRLNAIRYWFSSVAQMKEARGLMGETDRLSRNAERGTERRVHGDLPAAPAKRLAIVACMDARLNPFSLLGLRLGDAHIIRNAGGVVTADVIRSLAISQRVLGTDEIVLIHHTDCGMLSLDDDGFRREIQRETGIRPDWATEAFDDLEDDVRQSMARIRASPFIPRKRCVRGFIYDVTTGALREIDAWR